MIYLLLYVDDILIVCKDLGAINDLKFQLSTNFEMKDLDSAKRILGMQIKRRRKNNQLFLSQSDYLAKVVEKFEMEKAKLVLTPVAGHFKLSKDQEPQTKEEQTHMESVPTLMRWMPYVRHGLHQT
ncbi:unnamed protein product [Rhodiola kirilowii]